MDGGCLDQADERRPSGPPRRQDGDPVSVPQQASEPEQMNQREVDLDEASRQLDLAAHDIAVATSCIALGDLDSAHTNVITARAAADAAEEILRVKLRLDLNSWQ
jgi:hypothetical protein